MDAFYVAVGVWLRAAKTLERSDSDSEHDEECRVRVANKNESLLRAEEKERQRAEEQERQRVEERRVAIETKKRKKPQLANATKQRKVAKLTNLAKEGTAEFQLRRMRELHPSFEFDRCYEGYTCDHGHISYYTVKFSKNTETNKLVMQCVPYIQTRFNEDGMRNAQQFRPILDFSDENMLRTENLHPNQPLQLTTVVDPKMKFFLRHTPKILYVYRSPRNTSNVSQCPLILNGSIPCTRLRFTSGY